MAQQILSTNTFTTAKWIVSATASDGTHTTIAGALTSASSGDTIFIRPGTYTENLTLKAGVNLAAFNGDSAATGSSTVIITGKATLTAAGTVNISNIQLTTNSDFVIAVTGSAASIVILNNCYINASNNTAISFTTSSSSGVVRLNNCTGNLGTTGIGIFAHSASGSLQIVGTIISNGGNSSSANTCSAGSISMIDSFIANPITMSGTGVISMRYSEIDSSASNSTALTTVAGTSNQINYCRFASGTATPVSVGGTVNMSACELSHSNATGITGAGTLQYSNLMQSNTIGAISTTTLTPKFTIGAINSTVPPAGYIGQILTAAFTTPNTLTVNTITNVTSLTPTAGIWEITGCIQYNIATAVGMLGVQGCLATANNNFVAIDDFGGNVSCGAGNMPSAAASSQPFLLLGPCRMSTTGATVVYLNAYLGATSAGTRTYAGLIRAVRVG